MFRGYPKSPADSVMLSMRTLNEHSKVIFNFLFPSYKESSEFIQPRMGPFYNPSSCPKTRYVASYVFFSTTFDMRSITIVFNQFSDICEIITLIHAYILNILNYVLCRRSFKEYGV